jgi:hypothetical protein
MSSDVSFLVDVSAKDDLYGLILIVMENSDDEDEEERQARQDYYLVFRGKPEIGEEEVAKLFITCHREAMDTVNLPEDEDGSVPIEVYEQIFEDSLELAGDLMIRHNLESIDVETLSHEKIREVFKDTSDGILEREDSLDEEEDSDGEEDEDSMNVESLSKPPVPKKWSVN